ncbi:unnamed protein product [Lepeophtheirus salmonis]|uniref:(salmon louse) hypothetical protein n=1 Tax=Lepeophtheirus salmonis TaxID=72036 RepID=A0A7R8H483_LEPSM|nr:unnamed protein product [Lepeophtheirus salmonis]CAF2853011.1 unnamed protein product [Lepeophtheirus salmonis]
MQDPVAIPGIVIPEPFFHFSPRNDKSPFLDHSNASTKRLCLTISLHCDMPTGSDKVYSSNNHFHNGVLLQGLITTPVAKYNGMPEYSTTRDKPCSGRQRTSRKAENVTLVGDSVVEHSKTSIPRRVSQLHISARKSATGNVEFKSTSEPRIIGTNHEPSKIIDELLTSGSTINSESVLTLSLIGALALVTTSLVGLNSGQLSKRRSEIHNYYDYSDHEHDPQPTYVENIHNFENKVYKKFKKGVTNSLRRARVVGRRTSAGIGNVVNGVARVGDMVGSGLGRVGRVLTVGTQNGLRRAFSTIRGASYRAGRNVQTFMRSGKRMISYTNVNYTNYNSTTRDLSTESRQYDSEFKMEDCEVFECRLASLGRKAFGVISKMQNKKSDTP